MKNTRYDLIVFFGIYILYNVSFELSKWNATPGKKWVKIVVYNEENGVLPHQSFLRNVTKIFSLLLCFGGFVWILFNSKRKALHDYPAGTVVLFREE